MPLFILMGTVIAHAGLGTDAYDCFYKWLCRVRGGLAAVTTVTCAFFGTITGSKTNAGIDYIVTGRFMNKDILTGSANKQFCNIVAEDITNFNT